MSETDDLRNMEIDNRRLSVQPPFKPMSEELKCPVCGSNMDISYWEINHECQNGKTHYQLKNYSVIRWCAKEIERKDAEIARLREAFKNVQKSIPPEYEKIFRENMGDLYA